MNRPPGEQIPHARSTPEVVAVFDEVRERPSPGCWSTTTPRPSTSTT
jgi:hypothetical protein